MDTPEKRTPITGTPITRTPGTSVGTWGTWSGWSACGSPCIGSERTRTAPCISKTPNKTTTCPGVPPVEVKTCTDEECGMDVSYSSQNTSDISFQHSIIMFHANPSHSYPPTLIAPTRNVWTWPSLLLLIQSYRSPQANEIDEQLRHPRKDIVRNKVT